jgi:hypothetical protein
MHAPIVDSRKKVDQFSGSGHPLLALLGSARVKVSHARYLFELFLLPFVFDGNSWVARSDTSYGG